MRTKRLLHMNDEVGYARDACSTVETWRSGVNKSIKLRRLGSITGPKSRLRFGTSGIFVECFTGARSGPSTGGLAIVRVLAFVERHEQGEQPRKAVSTLLAGRRLTLD